MDATKKRAWGPGPWHDEDDRESGVAAGLPYEIRRHDELGHLCGYVGVAPEHPLYGKDYANEIAIDDLPHGWRDGRIGKDIGTVPALLAAMGDRAGRLRIDCALHAHGGITYANSGDAESKYLPASSWWFGFDCAHCGDLVPHTTALFRKIYEARGDDLRYGADDIYRDIAYVRAECERLAGQLAAMAGAKT